MTWEVGQTYPMRGGGEFHVLEIDGPGPQPIYGRERYPNGYPWTSATRLACGRVSVSGITTGDLMPPTPPVVVSDAVIKAYVAEITRPGRALDEGRRASISAAIAYWLTEHPHMLRAWQEGK